MRTLAAAAVLVMLGAGTATAQRYYSPAPPPPARASVLLGGGIGIGGFDVQFGDEEPEEYDEAFAYELRFGGMISPRFALGVELHGMSQDLEEDGFELTVYQRNLGAFVRWWATRRFWLQGGIASARIGASYGGGDDVTYKGLGMSGALGFEVLHAPQYALDIGLHLAGARYDTDDELGEDLKSQSVALRLAFNWFF
jgi:hypothetical protein